MINNTIINEIKLNGKLLWEMLRSPSKERIMPCLYENELSQQAKENRVTSSNRPLGRIEIPDEF